MSGKSKCKILKQIRQQMEVASFLIKHKSSLYIFQQEI